MKAVKLGHVGQQGKEKLKCFIRENIWFPSLNKAIEQLIDRSSNSMPNCWRGNQPEPIEILPTENSCYRFLRAYSESARVFFRRNRDLFKFQEIEVVATTDAKACFKAMDKIFTTH